MDNSKIRLRRWEASTYLKETHGMSRTPATLAKLAVTGGGPEFQMDGRIPLYPQSSLDKWASEKLGPLQNSTRGTNHDS